MVRKRAARMRGDPAEEKERRTGPGPEEKASSRAAPGRRRRLFRAVTALLAALIVCHVRLPVQAVNNFSLETAQETYENLPGTVIYTDGVTSCEVEAEVLSYYLKLPESVRELLAEYGCNIYLSQEANDNDAAALAAFAEKVEGAYATAAVTCMGGLWLDGEGNIVDVEYMPYVVYFSSISSSGDSLIHEVGHVLDFLAVLENGTYEGTSYGISSTAEWEAVYEAEKEALAAIDSKSGINAMKSKEEGFAEAFRLTFSNPEALAAACPLSCGFVLEIVEQLS